MCWETRGGLVRFGIMSLLVALAAAVVVVGSSGAITAKQRGVAKIVTVEKWKIKRVEDQPMLRVRHGIADRREV